MIEVKDITDVEMTYLKSWWDQHGVPHIPEAWLPSIRKMAFIDEHAICAAFLYHESGTKFGFTAWHTMNPGFRGSIRSAGMAALESSIAEEAKKLGITDLFAVANNPVLLMRLSDNGYRTADIDCVHCVKHLGG